MHLKCFIRALCNTDYDEYQSATKIRDLAKASYNVDFPAKNFAAAIIKPLEEKKLIEKKPSAGTHGGNASEIKLVGTVKADILAPVLQQIEIIAGKEVIKYCQKTLSELRVELDSDDTYVKGLALEAFAIKIMQIIDLDFAGTRVKGSDTGGAEVDVVFDTTRLNYSRWQVQCKNTPKVSLDQVAKEVGLSHVLKSNVIVILTTGKASSTAKEYAATIMKEMNLCIVFIEGDDINEILESPSSIVDVLNRESVVFHPDYTYSDFVGQILPRVVDDKLKYVFEPGPFTKMLKKAYDDPDNMYFLVIEEINRGNAPAIFGDIFQLLDRNDDGSGKYHISNYDIATIVYDDENHIIRTRNYCCFRSN